MLYPMTEKVSKVKRYNTPLKKWEWNWTQVIFCKDCYQGQAWISMGQGRKMANSWFPVRIPETIAGRVWIPLLCSFLNCRILFRLPRESNTSFLWFSSEAICQDSWPFLFKLHFFRFVLLLLPCLTVLAFFFLIQWTRDQSSVAWKRSLLLQEDESRFEKEITWENGSRDWR